MIIAVSGREFLNMDFIHRIQATSDDSPPWAGISFRQAVDSDHLADQLKTKYPECRTLRERKHKATIDFLIQELERMRTKDHTTPTVLTSENLPVSERRRGGSKAYIEISPDRSRPQSASSCTSPSLSGSVHSSVVSDRARLSASTKNGPQRTFAPNASSQQHVWNSQTGQPMRQKTKRKMTVDERKAYKITREQGACEPCRKQKARCTHATEGELLPIQCDPSSKPSKRRKSTTSDSEQPKKKPIKDEPSTDSFQLTPEPPQPRRVSAPVPHNTYVPMHEPAVRVTEPMLDSGQLGVGIRSPSSGKFEPDDTFQTESTLTPTNENTNTFIDATTDAMTL